MIRFACVWACLSAAYLAFAGTISASEGGAALLCGALGALWDRHLAPPAEASLPAREVLAQGARGLRAALAALPGEILGVGRILARAVLRGGVRGSTQHWPAARLSPYGLADPGRRAAAGRAAGLVTASVSPGSYVLRLDPARNGVTAHALSADAQAPTGGRVP